MKAEFKEVTWLREYPNQYKEGEMMHVFRVVFLDADLNEIQGEHTSKSKDQTYFQEGKEAEFLLEEKKNTKTGKMCYAIKRPKMQGGNPNYTREKKREQTRYSGFAMSYAKDLVIADKIKFDQILPAAKKMFDYMVELDKSIES